ncbi:hypothetical protein P5673_002384 [Acropora cervicornis]|uniref:Uncharacterized protein n=1 Tax=Acropora cervicornis TaxID=6130 RepID=A0AAD9R2Y1_ACRCE|nr:hypothetical protein P5673_002384 [Acropora cervicornis]
MLMASCDVEVKAQFLLGAGKVDPRSLRYQGLSVEMIGNVCIPLNSFCVREKRKNFDVTTEKDALFEEVLQEKTRYSAHLSLAGLETFSVSMLLKCRDF